jgi:hypothetical protein
MTEKEPDVETETTGPDATEAEAPAASATPAEPEEQLSPKERRGRKRSAHAGEAGAQRTIKERNAERLERGGWGWVIPPPSAPAPAALVSVRAW